MIYNENVLTWTCTNTEQRQSPTEEPRGQVRTTWQEFMSERKFIASEKGH